MSLERAKEYLKKYELDSKIMEFEVSSATVEEAAKAINCKEEEIAKTLNAPVKKGRVVGNVKYFLGDQELASFPVVTKEEVRERTFCWCLAFAAQRFCF